MGRHAERRLAALGKRADRLAVPRAAADDFSRYADDPVGFIREVLRAEPWSAQVVIAESVRDARQVVVRSCNGAGKDWLAAGLAVWWVYARGGSVLMTGPAERQVKEVLVPEMRRAVRRAGLPGEVLELGLRTERHGSVLAFTSNDVSRLTGFHAPRVLGIITEAQGCGPATWEALHACCVGDDDRLLAVGNPLAPSGPFFDACRSDRWVSHRISALEHPNLVAGRVVIPGGVTAEFVRAVAEEFGGEGSPVYQARVLGEFPDTADEGLVPRSWVLAAFDRWRTAALEAATQRAPLVAALDVARFGADQSVLAVRQGPVLRHLVAWQQLDTMQTVGRLGVELGRLGLHSQDEGLRVVDRVGRFTVPVPVHRPGYVTVLVDEIGVGAGVLDRLKELGHAAQRFNSSATPTVPGKFLNTRAEAFWTLRRLLEQGTIALPPDDRLADELTALRWTVNSTGKIQIEPKEEARARLGRSPDRADAVAMAFHGLRAGGVWRQGTFNVF